MQDIINSILDLIRSILRFKWVVLIFAWIFSILGWVYVYQMDEKYDASARVFVDSNRILAPLLKGIAVQPDVKQRVSLLSRTLLNRPTLEKLARMSDLDVEATTDLEKEKLIDQLAEDITLSGTRGNSSVYRVTYSHGDPQLAKRMVQGLITIFVESAIGDERKDTEVTQAFLDQQIQYYEGQLVEADARLAAFKRSNFGLLPDDREKNEQKLDGFKVALNRAQQDLAVAESKLEVYQKQLARQPRRLVQSVSGGASPVSTIGSQLQELRTELAYLTTRYTEKYPRIGQLRSRINALEQQQTQLNSSKDDDNVNYTSVPNPTYEELQTQYTLAEIEVGALRRQVADNAASVEQLESTLDSMPDVAKELNRILRGNDSLLNTYHEMLDRRESARLSEQVEQNVDDVNFRVIDPPFVSSNASGPGKELLSAGVFMVALGLGSVSAFALSLLVPVFYDPSTIAKNTGRSVLGSVSQRLSWPVRIFRSINWMLVLFVAGLLVLVFVVIESHYLGLLSADRVQALMSSSVGPILNELISITTQVVEEGKSRFGL